MQWLRMIKIVTPPQVDLSNPRALPSLQHPPASCTNLQPKCRPFPPTNTKKGVPFFLSNDLKKAALISTISGWGFQLFLLFPPPFILYYRMYRVGNRYFPLSPRLLRKGGGNS